MSWEKRWIPKFILATAALLLGAPPASEGDPAPSGVVVCHFENSLVGEVLQVQHRPQSLRVRLRFHYSLCQNLHFHLESVDREHSTVLIDAHASTGMREGCKSEEIVEEIRTFELLNLRAPLKIQFLKSKKTVAVN